MLDRKFLSFSKCTFYEIQLLENLSSDILFKHCGFHNFCQSYNHFFKIAYIENSRSLLNRKRLTETWILYRYSKFCLEKWASFKRFIFDLDKALLEIRPYLLDYFVKKWNNPMNHKAICKENCSKLLVIDGLHKVNHRVCLYKDKQLDVLELNHPLAIGCNSTPIPGILD